VSVVFPYLSIVCGCLGLVILIMRLGLCDPPVAGSSPARPTSSLVLLGLILVLPHLILYRAAVDG
jgi:hypothetical protein